MLVESGNLSAQPERFGIVMSVLAGLGYDAVGVGETDLRTGAKRFFEEAAKHKLTVLDSGPDAAKSTLPYVIKNVAGVKVGIVSFGGRLSTESSGGEYVRRKAMYTAYRAARLGSDYLIVLDQGNVIDSDWINRNGKRLGEPDLVVAGTARSSLAEPEVVGRARIVPTSIQGKQMGVIDVEITPGYEPKVTWTRILLDETVAEDTKTKELVSAFMTSPESNQPPGTQNVPVAQGTAPLPANSVYYSPELCKTCHIKEYQDWAKSKHAAAIKTLVDAKRMVPECLPCHSEEYRQLKTVAIPEDNVGGVECATCHMEALPHDLERRNVAHKTSVNPLGCLSCHTKERSPKYDQQAYFPKVAHGAASAVASAKPTSPH